ncbi:uncharacterized protein LOC112083090 [Eutrema salsugineum]|uniref:uncharacterized protein LOC112083090 n=1 Tax=Eutrema salsugineum TaxID=72664 RepID=UPI000CED768D|nr:uncharacterized protein LOC112083090 [Eutrema salsugineum]
MAIHQIFTCLFMKPLQMQMMLLLLAGEAQVVGNTGSGSSGSKRSPESDASDSNFLGIIARLIGRDAPKKKAKKKVQELERLNKIAYLQEEANQRQKEKNQLMKEKTQARKMKMWLKLSEKEHLDDQSKELLQKLSYDLFGK